MSNSDLSPQTPEASFDPVNDHTFEDLKSAMLTIVKLKARQGNRKGPETGVLRFGGDRVGVDFDRERSALGSGQVYDAQTDLEYVVWVTSEGESPTWDVNGETLTPLGFVHTLSADPSDTDESLSHVVVPVEEGRVFEIDEGRYFSDDPTSIRELGEPEVHDLVLSMEDVATRI